MADQSQTPTKNKSMTWLLFALMTVAAWGVYGILLHAGAVGMGDPVNGRYKAFLLVGIAYFVTAVLAPFLVLVSNGVDWNIPFKGAGYSFIAGVVGAIGAFGVILAFGAKGTPAVVMSIIFAGAPVVNAFVAMSLHPPKGGWNAIPAPFWIGIAMAATGGCLVTLYNPGSAKKKPAAAAVAPAIESVPVARLDLSAYEIGRRD